MSKNKGTTFSLDDKHGESQGDWFQFFESELDLDTGVTKYFPPEKGAGSVCIRPMGPFWEERLKGRAKLSEFVLNPKTRSMERVEWYESLSSEDEVKEREDAFDYGIVGFKDLYDKTGKEIECTRENKLLLLSKPVFDRFIARCYQLQQAYKVEAAEVVEKNSGKP